MQFAKLGGALMSWPTSERTAIAWDNSMTTREDIDCAAAYTFLDVDATGKFVFGFNTVDKKLEYRSRSTDVRVEANKPYYLKVSIPLQLDSNDLPVSGSRTSESPAMQVYVSENGSDWQLAATTDSVDVYGNTFFAVKTSGKRWRRY